MTLPRTSILTAAAAAVALAGIAVAAAQTAPERPDFNGTSVQSITSPLRDSNGATIGSVQLWEDSDGVVKVFVGASGLTAGAHGLHIHAVGHCSGPAFTTAGGHFNPHAKKHGLLAPDGHHAGDLPGLDVGADGTATYITTTEDVTLSAGPKSIFDTDGSSLIIHAGPDDQLTDPTGNSGARVACAVLANAAPGSIPTAVTTVATTVTTVATTTAPAPPNTGSGTTTERGLPGVMWAALVGIAASAVAGKWALARR